MSRSHNVTIIRPRDLHYDARILRIARTLSENGYQVQIIYLPTRGSSNSLNIPGVTTCELHLATRSLPRWKTSLALKYLEFLLRSIAVAYQSKADLYSAGTTDSLLAAYVVSRITGAKVLYEAQELYPETDTTIFPRLWVWLERHLLPLVDGITSANEERAEVMYREYNAPSKPVVISNCPPIYDPSNVERIQWPIDSQQGDWEVSSKVVLYQGLIAPGRALLSLISSLQYLSENIYLALVGPQDAQFLKYARKTAEQAGVQDRIMWFGPIPWQQLNSYTVSADLGVVFYEPTCRNNYLCAPNKLYDYLMAGLPIIGSDLPEIRRVLDETGAGVVVNSSDPCSIAAGIREILSNQERWEAMSIDGREAATHTYCWEKQATKLISVYDNALARSK